MIGFGYDDGWAEDLESWEELADLLCSDWDRVEHTPLGLSLERADGLLAFDLRERWHARHRRGLHRLGFRAVALGGVEVWKWDVEPQLHTTDLSRFASSFESIFADERSAAVVVRRRTSLARDHLVREQALRVLRDVFRCHPGDLGVLLVRGDDDWGDDDEEEVWPLPGG
ncbi:hypothetical protein BH24ACT10_BH24ACT10_10390 [soil metagenome]